MGCGASKSESTAEKSTLTFAVLKQQDDVTSNAILKSLKDSEDFKTLSTSEGNDLIKRDQEDETKLAKGIEISVAKGVLEANPEVPAIKQVDVAGKTADEVCDDIVSQLPGKEGNVIILQGLSGTGKGTTVGKLTKALENCVCWSNGNVFRSFTWMATQHCEEKGIEFCTEILTAELLATFVERVKFEKQEDGTFDVVLDGKTRVSTIANTELKKPIISARVPTVAEQTQGEVVKFAAGAIEQLTKAGHNVIIEGRAQTLQYIPSPSRFELVIHDTALLGSRRAAQRVMAAGWKLVETKESATDAEVKDAVNNAVASMVDKKTEDKAAPAAAETEKYTPAGPVYFVLGGPGSGKGTNCAKLVEEYGFCHLSAGDLLRAEAKKDDSEVGQKIAALQKEGQIVPMEITIGLMVAAMKETPNTNGYLLDGFPRKMDQALKFEEDVVVAAAVLYFDLPEETMLERIKIRAEETKAAGGELRADDNEEAVKKRFHTNKEQCTPVVEKYEAEGRLKTFDASKSKDDVFADLKKVMDELRGGGGDAAAPVDEEKKETGDEAKTEETPAATEEAPAATEEAPAATEEAPAATEEKKEDEAKTEEAPAATEEAKAEEAPATEEAPAATEEKKEDEAKTEE